MKVYTRITPGTHLRLGLFGWLFFGVFIAGAFALYLMARALIFTVQFWYRFYNARKAAKRHAELRRALAINARYQARHIQGEFVDERPTAEFPAVR